MNKKDYVFFDVENDNDILIKRAFNAVINFNQKVKGEKDFDNELYMTNLGDNNRICLNDVKMIINKLDVEIEQGRYSIMDGVLTKKVYDEGVEKFMIFYKTNGDRKHNE